MYDHLVLLKQQGLRSAEYDRFLLRVFAIIFSQFFLLTRLKRNLQFFPKIIQPTSLSNFAVQDKRSLRYGTYRSSLDHYIKNKLQLKALTMTLPQIFVIWSANGITLSSYIILRMYEESTRVFSINFRSWWLDLKENKEK